MGKTFFHAPLQNKNNEYVKTLDAIESSIMQQTVIKQHYIPKSYLKNFGFLVNARRKKWSVYTIENGGQIERRATTSICTIDYLYDLPLVGDESKQFIEHAYDKEVDKHFPSITKFLENESNKTLPMEMRERILKSCLSLYYRTPRFVELDNQALEEIKMLPKNQQKVAWKWKKTQLLQDHIKNFEALYLNKKHCGISINKVVGNYELISSDNPVIIRNMNNERVHELNDNNIIHIPLTPKIAISIMPTKERDLYDTFYQYFWDEDNVMALNSDIEQLHQKYLLGTEKALQTYLNDSPEYKKPVDANHPKSIKIREMKEAMSRLIIIFESSGNMINSNFINEFYKIWNSNDIFRNDPNAIYFKEMLIKKKASDSGS
ncbi:MAG: hypothetical protein A2W90_05670 [Bacteroidetes bacterium GWF2_42_66]|nr:MAG: hypothetical protein A2W92_01055 [Bacteroidetes bacterium GWA2_42_15]OFY03534.1 MAG: hypothetical protein A2W89_18395 [Bacteroidetes bacterium GWE2_42_39]OFY45899.1 MAG: hypothetical protein A2W90_05670 [Bacteroidetes bacterium GWF2_42_66]HBL75141.1 hypothetical protein [Prolixibacteraceae bacterium]HCR91619.1 hypothetical protein [Prolixibacteraceae bacterium]